MNERTDIGCRDWKFLEVALACKFVLPICFTFLRETEMQKCNLEERVRSDLERASQSLIIYFDTYSPMQILSLEVVQ